MSIKDEYSFIFKIILIGPSGVGKSEILEKYIDNNFRGEREATVGVEFRTKTIQKDKDIIKLNIWDTAGKERYRSITSAYYKGAKGCLVVYDITNKSSFDNVDEFINIFKKEINNSYSIILIGNKSDAEKERKVSKEEGKEKAKKYNIDFLETSALNGDCIKEAFDKLFNDLITKNKEINRKEEEKRKKEEEERRKEEEERKKEEEERKKEEEERKKEEEEEEEEEENILEKQENEIINEEIGKIKCSLKKHKEVEANIYCQECRIYMCNKCEKNHSELFENHHQYNIDKNKNFKNIFTGYCKEKNHFGKLIYFCKNHNQLCCSSCISKIKGLGNGKHKDCEVCFIKKIKKEKKEKLKENIKILEEISKNIKESIEQLKKEFEIIRESKEKLKIQIQNVFTKIKNFFNNREDELFLEVDKIYDELFFKEDLIKESEKLPTKIEISLEKGKIDEKEWDDKKKLKFLINDCICIENEIKDINILNETINKINSEKNFEIKFSPGEEETNKISEELEKFGEIIYNKNK